MLGPVTFTDVQIDASSPEHTYLQLAALLRKQIASGEIVSQLPSITELTEETGLAVGTVRRAIKVLVQEGLVRTVPGRGTYVTGKPSRPARGQEPSAVPVQPESGQARLGGYPAGRIPPHGHVRH
jgi:GntR family transcriptional regulator